MSDKKKQESQLEALKQAGWVIGEPIILDGTEYEKEQLRKAREAGDEKEYSRILEEIYGVFLMPKSIYEAYVAKHSYLFTNCTDCSNPGATLDKTYSEDGKWFTITKLCENCKEDRRLKRAFKAATCGPTNIDANGSPL